MREIDIIVSKYYQWSGLLQTWLMVTRKSKSFPARATMKMEVTFIPLSNDKNKWSSIWKHLESKAHICWKRFCSQSVRWRHSTGRSAQSASGRETPPQLAPTGDQHAAFKRQVPSFWIRRTLLWKHLITGNFPKTYCQVQPESRSQCQNHVDHSVSNAKYRWLQLLVRIRGGLSHGGQFPFHPLPLGLHSVLRCSGESADLCMGVRQPLINLKPHHYPILVYSEIFLNTCHGKFIEKEHNLLQK